MVSNLELSSGFGISGTVVSFLVFLSPLPTFIAIYRAKSTPYVMALFGCLLTLYYGFVKPDSKVLLVTINTAGIVLEASYLAVFVVYAPKRMKVKTVCLIVGVDVILLGLIILLVSLLTHGFARESVMGWITAICTVCFFAAPLSAMGRVIRTRSVEFMPFWLSLSMTVSAMLWFFYGFFTWNFFIAVPNVLGLLFGIIQLTLHCIYRERR